jgi:hypothetical protein
LGDDKLKFALTMTYQVTLSTSLRNSRLRSYLWLWGNSNAVALACGRSVLHELLWAPGMFGLPNVSLTVSHLMHESPSERAPGHPHMVWGSKLLAFQGEARFVATSKEKKIFFTLAEAAKELGAILSAVPDFRPADFKVGQSQAICIPSCLLIRIRQS